MDSSVEASSRGLEPVFEGFAIGLISAKDEKPAREAVAAVLDATWDVRPLGSLGTEFEVTHSAHMLKPSDAWEAAYRLREHPGVAYAEPLFAVSVYDDPNRIIASDDSERSPFEAAESVQHHLPESDEPEWGLRMTRVTEAWDLFFGGDPMRAGAGVVIGHPDTGYERHPEIVDSLLVDKGYDFVKGDSDPRDELEKVLKVLIDNPSHGTQTASVIISPRGPKQSYLGEDGKPDDPTGKAVCGVAPGSRLIPIRTSRTVALTSMRGLVKAIHHAVDQGSHVISISMGGVPSRALKRAVAYAERQGVIVCAAAGNQVRFVVWPAGYEEVVAAAACNAAKKPWKGSSRGSRVTATAPGESVWRAHVLRDPADETAIVPRLGRGSGTSYAVAHIAGLAALWLSHHGRDSLIERYGKENVPSLFRQMLKGSCAKVDLLGKGFGDGLVDAVRLLEMELPPAMAFEAARLVQPGGLEAAEAVEQTIIPSEEPQRNLLALFNADLPPSPFESVDRPHRLSETLAQILNTPRERLDERLDEVGDELIFHLMTDPGAYDAVQQALEAPPGLEMAGATPETARARLKMHSLSGRLAASIK